MLSWMPCWWGSGGRRVGGGGVDVGWRVFRSRCGWIVPRWREPRLLIVQAYDLNLQQDIGISGEKKPKYSLFVHRHTETF